MTVGVFSDGGTVNDDEGKDLLTLEPAEGSGELYYLEKAGGSDETNEDAGSIHPVYLEVTRADGSERVFDTLGQSGGTEEESDNTYGFYIYPGERLRIYSTSGSGGGNETNWYVAGRRVL